MSNYTKIYHQLSSDDKKVLTSFNQRISYSSMNYITCKESI